MNKLRYTADASKWKSGVASIYDQLSQDSANVLTDNVEMDELVEKAWNSLLDGQVLITMKNGEKLEGILEAVDPQTMSLYLKNWRVGEQKVVSTTKLIDGTGVIYVTKKNFREVKKAKAFQTDTSISALASGRERVLKKWEDDFDDTPNVALGKNVPKWDQFAANEKQFGVTTDFNEDDYTTILDKSGANFKTKEAIAAKLAREMEATSTKNPHLQEERGQIVLDVDEETKYSSVVRPKPAAKSYSQTAAKSIKKTIVSKLNSTAIRKASIEQISSYRNQKIPPYSGNPSKEVAREQSTVRSQMEHLKDRKNSILKEGRQGVMNDFRQFSKDFQMPAVLKAKEPELPKVLPKVIKDVKVQTKEVLAKEAIIEVAKEAIKEVKVESKEEKKPKHTMTKVIKATEEKDVQEEKKSFVLSVSAVEFTPTTKPTKKGKGKQYYNNQYNNQYYPQDAYADQYYQQQQQQQQQQYFRPQMMPYPPMPFDGQQQVPYGYIPQNFNPEMMPPHQMYPAPWYNNHQHDPRQPQELQDRQNHPERETDREEEEAVSSEKDE